MDENQKEVHFVCNSCGGVSHKAKSCGTDGCDMNGQPLEVCDCEMPEHLEKAKQSKENEENVEE